MPDSTMKFAILLFAFVALQLVALLLFASRLRKTVLRSPLLGAALVLLTIESLCAISLALGAYSESRWDVTAQLREMLNGSTITPRQAITHSINPGLLATLDAQSPAIPSPNLAERDAFQTWQSALRDLLINDIFLMPGISEPEPVKFTVENAIILADGLIRQEVTFSAFDGVEIPAYLFLPREAEPRPAIVVIPGHVRESESGIEQTAGLVDSYQHGAARELARAGFVTFTFELRGFGQLGTPHHTEHRLVAYNAVLAGTFYKALISKDVKSAVDLIQSLPQVDANELGITGASYGGEMAVTYAALDTRIKAIVFQAFGGGMGDFRGITGTKKDQPHYDHIIPGANTILQQQDIFLLLAPRPTLGIRGAKEPFREPSFSTLLQAGWEAFGRPANLELRIEPGGHEYFVEPAVAFFKAKLHTR